MIKFIKLKTLKIYGITYSIIYLESYLSIDQVEHQEHYRENHQEDVVHLMIIVNVMVMVRIITMIVSINCT